MSDKYLTVIRKWDFCSEDTVFVNDTSGKAARSEKMLKQLRSLKLISEAEYQLVEKKLKKDYSVISNITA